MITLPEIGTYGDYVSMNYGAHCLKVTVGSLTVYFSYKTPVAFKAPGQCVIRENDWNVTTGKHLNWINPDKSKRIPGAAFEQALKAELESREPVL